MAMKVKLNVPYPVRENGVRRIAKPGDEILLHSHLAMVEQKRGKVQIIGPHIGDGVARREKEEQKKKAKKASEKGGKKKRGRPRKHPLPETTPAETA
jgi:hypothetical protein